MLVLQVGPYPQDSQLIRGGVEASVYGLSRELSKSTQVVVIDIPRLGIEDSVEDFDSIQVYRFNNPGPNQKNAAKRINDIINHIMNIKPTICHIHGTGRFGYLMFKQIKKHHIPVIVTVHGLLNVEKKNALKHQITVKNLYQYVFQGYYEKQLLASVDEAIVDTEYVIEAINKYSLGSTSNLHVIPQGINEVFFSLTGSRLSRTILSIGSISRRKGHLKLVKAFDIAAREIDDIELVICGIVSENGYYEELRDYISSLSCKDRISLRINVPLEDLYRLYSQAHVFALHSQEESQGIVFAEAMASGLPIVATRVGGVPNVIKEGVTGYLCEYGDIVCFSELLKRIMSDDYAWESLSNKCKTTAQDYSWAVITESVKKEYFRILEK